MDDYILIDQVQMHEHLYDKSRPDYKDAEKKNNTWKMIAEILGNVSADDCQKRFKNLRDRYAKFQKSKKSGSGYSQPPPIFEKLQFLDSHITHRKSSSNFTFQFDDTENDFMESQASTSYSQSSTHQSLTSPKQYSPEVDPPPKRPKTKHDLEEQILAELQQNTLQLKQEKPATENEHCAQLIKLYLDKLDERSASQARIYLLNYMHNLVYKEI